MVDHKLKIVGLLIVLSLGAFYIFSESDDELGHSDNPQRLRILTYSSFTSDYGPGKKLASIFKEKQGVDVEFVNSESALTMLAKVKRGEKADLVIGIDRFSKFDFTENIKWKKHGISLANRDIYSQLNISDSYLIPFNWAPMAFIYNKKLVKAPKTINELFSGKYRLSAPDPRFSSPGKAFLFWLSTTNSEIRNKFNKVHKNTRWSPSWSSAYSLFQSGHSDVVYTYLTSIVYHRKNGQNDFQVALSNVEHAFQAEYAGLLNNCLSCEVGKKFLKFMTEPEAQKIIMNSNFMLSIDKNIVKESDFSKLPQFFLIGNNVEAHEFEKSFPEIIKKWKSASRK